MPLLRHGDTPGYFAVLFKILWLDGFPLALTRDLVFGAYQEAVDHRYRSYSFGDAMLLL